MFIFEINTKSINADSLVHHTVGRLSIEVSRVELGSQWAQAQVLLLPQRRSVDHRLVHDGASPDDRVLRREDSVPRDDGTLSGALRWLERLHVLDKLLLRFLDLSLDL